LVVFSFDGDGRHDIDPSGRRHMQVNSCEFARSADPGDPVGD
jgi:hypothetical protein